MILYSGPLSMFGAPAAWARELAVPGGAGLTSEPIAKGQTSTSGAFPEL